MTSEEGTIFAKYVEIKRHIHKTTLVIDSTLLENTPNAFLLPQQSMNFCCSKRNLFGVFLAILKVLNRTKVLIDKCRFTGMYSCFNAYCVRTLSVTFFASDVIKQDTGFLRSRSKVEHAGKLMSATKRSFLCNLHELRKCRVKIAQITDAVSFARNFAWGKFDLTCNIDRVCPTSVGSKCCLPVKGWNRASHV